LPPSVAFYEVLSLFFAKHWGKPNRLNFVEVSPLADPFLSPARSPILPKRTLEITALLPRSFRCYTFLLLEPLHLSLNLPLRFSRSVYVFRHLRSELSRVSGPAFVLPPPILRLLDVFLPVFSAARFPRAMDSLRLLRFPTH